MSELVLETIDAPSTFGENALRPADEELRSIGTTVDSLVTSPSHFGFDEVGTALSEAFEALRESISARLQEDAEAIVASADALQGISEQYQALVTANTPAAR